MEQAAAISTRANARPQRSGYHDRAPDLPAVSILNADEAQGKVSGRRPTTGPQPVVSLRALLDPAARTQASMKLPFATTLLILAPFLLALVRAPTYANGIDAES